VAGSHLRRRCLFRTRMISVTLLHDVPEIRFTAC
jgi:hypothetical protein